MLDADSLVDFTEGFKHWS